jgi:uncharacterized protein with GYD domain
MAMNFVTLMTLTPKGRERLAAAAESLATVGKDLEELGGKCGTLLVTYGRYDAIITGECPSPEAFAQLMGLLHGAGLYTTETHVGVHPVEFKHQVELTPRHHS